MQEQSDETKQSSESDLDVTEMFELSEKELKITIINILKALMEEVVNMQDQTCKVSTDKETITKNQKEMLEI